MLILRKKHADEREILYFAHKRGVVIDLEAACLPPAGTGFEVALCQPQPHAERIHPARRCLVQVVRVPQLLHFALSLPRAG